MHGDFVGIGTKKQHKKMKTTAPNILLITADQFRWDCLGWRWY